MLGVRIIFNLMAVGKIIKKVPIVVGNCTAFAVNQTFFPYTQGAYLSLNLGVDVFKIDRLIRHFGLPISPFYFAMTMAIFDAMLSYCKLLPRIMTLHNLIDSYLYLIVGQLHEVSNETNNAELKLFLEVEFGQVMYVGRLFVKANGKPTEVLTKLNELTDFTFDEEMELFEEIKFENLVMCEHVYEKLTFCVSQV
ncbi:hypothetical protein RHSIM_Rhsim13G0117900 [Rhododendron simsii]|uniref:Ubiquitin carboxyl-terminal hydrolase 7 ICP0-binding domain-containing protein n=1 Tax=Rhododendron simsii TaxID=118357 RepID=A0A834L490_RHOSS|nr:hypothetical protein RHSIM_Rhsim13G0117900 [Rhododendron simsii]